MSRATSFTTSSRSLGARRLDSNPRGDAPDRPHGPVLTWRAQQNRFIQYNTDSGQWSSSLRFNIIHRPLSDFFLVYNDRRDERTGDLVNRALVAKMTYLLAF
jgi:hypothetical protein